MEKELLEVFDDVTKAADAAKSYDVTKQIVIDETTQHDVKKGSYARNDSLKRKDSIPNSPRPEKVQKLGAVVKVEKVPKAEQGDFKMVGRDVEVKKPKLTNIPKTNVQARDRVRGILHEALSKVSQESRGNEKFADSVNACDPIRVAVTVESVLFQSWGGSNGSKKAKYRSLIFNLKDQKNPDFRRKVLLGDIKAERLVDMSTAEMASDERQWENKKLEEKALFECERGRAPKATTDQFKCGRCGKRKTTYYQMQTRSADEPMTTYVTCVNCNNRWKFC